VTTRIINILQFPKWRRWKGIRNLCKVKVCASLAPFKQLWMVANLSYVQRAIFFTGSLGGKAILISK